MKYDSITGRGVPEGIAQRIAQLKQLPEDRQEAIATRLLAEIQDELNWTTRFEATTDEQWEAIAQSVREEIAAGDTTPISGTPGYKLLRFAGSIPAEDLQIMAEAIQEDCNRIDIEEW